MFKQLPVKFVLVFLFVSLGIVVFLVYREFSFNDEYQEYSEMLERVQVKTSELEGNDLRLSTILRVSEFNYEECFIRYCLAFNDCQYTIHSDLFCSESDQGLNEYWGPSEYKLSLIFRPRSFLFFQSNNMNLHSWELERQSQNELGEGFTELGFYEDIKLSLRELLDEHYLWETHNVPFPYYSVLTLEHWELNESIEPTNNYFKSLYYLHSVSESLADTEMEGYFDREILYLNENVEEIIENNPIIEGRAYTPPGYILKLLDLGLSDEYMFFIESLPFYEEWEEQTYDINLVHIKIEFEEVEKEKVEHYPLSYLRLINHLDNYRISEENELSALKNYSYVEILSIYEQNPEIFPYAVCSMASNIKGSVTDDQVKEIVETKLTEHSTQGSSFSHLELLMCQSYSERNNFEIEGLNEALEKSMIINTFNTQDYKYFIVRSAVYYHEGVRYPFLNFNILDNLFYLLFLDE